MMQSCSRSPGRSSRRRRHPCLPSRPPRLPGFAAPPRPRRPYGQPRAALATRSTTRSRSLANPVLATSTTTTVSANLKIGNCSRRTMRGCGRVSSLRDRRRLRRLPFRVRLTMAFSSSLFVCWWILYPDFPFLDGLPFKSPDFTPFCRCDIPQSSDRYPPKEELERPRVCVLVSARTDTVIV